MLIECIKLVVLTVLIIFITKYILVNLVRKLAENIHLGAKTVGNIAGMTTSVPELLTVSFSAIGGFLETSVFNIISSNSINFILYIVTIFANKNGRHIKNKAIQIDLSIVGITIVVPLFMVIWQNSIPIGIVPGLLILFVIAYWINYNAHKLYIDEKIEVTEKLTNNQSEKTKNILIYSILLILVGSVLFIIGECMHTILSNLTLYFQIPEYILGILLGIVTSLPEFITFLESQKHHSMYNEEGVIEATNNLLTSNLFNLCIIQSIGIILYVMVK